MEFSEEVGSQRAHPQEPGHKVLANTLFVLLAELVSKVASLALLVAMARKLGPAPYGAYTFGFSFVALLLTVAHFGQDQLLTREVSARGAAVHALFPNTLLLKVAIALPVLAGGIGILLALGEETTVVLAAAIIGIGGLSEALISTCFAVFQSYERLQFVPIVLISQRLLTAAAGIAALSAGAGIVGVALLYACGALLALILASRLLRRIVRIQPRINIKQWHRLIRDALPIGIAGVLATVLFRMDTAILAIITNDTSVGLYGAAYRLVDTTLFLSWSVSAAAYPVFSRLRAGDVHLASVVARSVKLALALTLPVTLGTLLMADSISNLLYGPEYQGTASALRLLAPTIALYPLVHLTGLFLISQRRAAIVTKIYAAVTVLNLCLNLLLIPRLSFRGAAISTSLTEVLLCAALFAPTLRVIGLDTLKRIVAGPIIAVLAAAPPMAMLRPNPLIAVALSTTVYATVLLLLEKFLYPSDLLSMLRSLHPRRAGGRCLE
jgi:O-antigen/teichoic acid export membrane protein